MFQIFCRKSVPALYIKTFFCFTTAFVLVFLCISFLLRPNEQKNYSRIYNKPYELQNALNRDLEGKGLAEISQYIQEHPDEQIHQAYVLTRLELLTPEIASRYSITLEDGMRFQLLQGQPFKSGKSTYYNYLQSNRLSFPFNLFPQSHKAKVSSESSSSKKNYEFPHIRIFSFDEFCTFDDFITYVYYWTYQKPEIKYACRHPNPAIVVVPIKNTPYVLVIRRPIYTPPQIPTLSIILATAVSIFILLFTVFILIFPIIASIQRVRTTCQKVCEGDFTARCHPPRKDVMRDLALNVDEMTSSIERHLTQQKNLLQAVSHELRTPLARIRFAIEMLDIDENDEKSVARLVSIDEDLSEIDNLIHELSYFNYVDGGNGCHQFETSSVKDLVETALHQRSHDLVKLDVQQEGLTDDLMVDADPTAFKRVIGNLLSNAARYAKSTIRITAQVNADQSVEISVEDDGPGIPEEQRESIFEPFRCLDASRSKANNGFGLGLAIAHRIMRIHHGSIAAKASSLGGTCMVTVWPVHPDVPKT